MTRNPKNKKRNTKAVSSMFDSIPHELVSEVLSRVASSSIKDIFNAKLSCKMLNEIAEDTYVYQRVSLDEVPIIPWKPISQEQVTFLNRCLQSENPESLYRQAVVSFLISKN
ncbi:PREDICTED: putative F-box protein At1g67623 [Erythranthe guttata]|uniref:putative F-box protein At1g67623 n=1 Tax=Erythranthe guttata TaxID=4155 RepID=UPI00064DB1A7|nr:PREDICTED: putative F-box protein At1g67623 [Erythranthe guttata]|eukprot:XP_012846894.1 PREDICTED: putative F-box protein At1g67623 [Erythranthe guttata]